MRTLVALWLVLVAAGCIHTRVVEDGALQRDGLEHTAVETARLRRLPFVREVPSRAVDRDGQKAFLQRYLDTRGPQLDVDTRLYRRLGVLHGEQTMRKVLERQFSSGAIAGFYTWEGGGQLYVSTDYDFFTRMQLEAIGWMTGIDWAYELVLVHELVHALQDQHYDLATFAGEGLEQTNEDLLLARTDVIESDAGLAGFAHFHGIDQEGWLQRRLNAAVIVLNYAPFAVLPQLAFPGVPPFFAKRSLGHYLRGIGYVNARLDEGGYAALDAAYRDGLLQSTEQLLWPYKRNGPDHDPPVSISPLPFEHEALEGFVRARSNVFGELQWRLLLEDHLWIPGAAMAAAKGWGGDRYELYVRGDEDVLVWRTAWDTADDAEEIERAWRDTLPGRYPGALVPDGEGYRLPDGRGVARLVRRGRRLVIVEGAVERPDELIAAAFASFDGPPPSEPPLPQPAEIPHDPGAPDAILDVSDRALPPPRAFAPTLRDRFFVRARRVSLSFGAGARIQGDRLPTYLYANEQLGPVGELRWGVRPGLQWSDPLVLSASFDSRLGQTILTSGFDTIPLITPQGAYVRSLFRSTHVVNVLDRVALAGQIGGLAQLDTLIPDDTLGVLSVAAGVYVQPLEGITLGVSVGRDTVVDFVGPLTGTRPYSPGHLPLRVGSALVRGRAFRQPLIEVQLFDMIHAWWASSLLFREGWEIEGQEHAMGATLFF